MKIPTQVTFRGFPHSEAVEANVRQKAEKLDRFYPNIKGCHVVLEAQHRYHQHGYLYHVSVDLTVPGRELVPPKTSGLSRRGTAGSCTSTETLCSAPISTNWR